MNDKEYNAGIKIEILLNLEQENLTSRELLNIIQIEGIDEVEQMTNLIKILQELFINEVIERKHDDLNNKFYWKLKCN